MSRLLNVQILRAFAALFVVVFHCGLEMERIAEATVRVRLFDHVRWSLGVSLFFTISGFIMVVTCYRSFGKPGEAWKFMKRRLLRIAPIYWLLTCAMLAVTVVAPSLIRVPIDDPFAFPLSLLFWPFARPDGEIRPLVTPGWTLNLEVYFYVVFAAGLLLDRWKGLALVIFAILGVCAVRGGGMVGAIPLTFWGDPIVLGFVFGMGVGALYMNGFRLSGTPALMLIVLGTGLSFNSIYQTMPEDMLVARLALSLPATLVLAGASFGPQVDAGKMVWRGLIIIGDASYSLYLVHEFFLRPLRLGWMRFIGDALPLSAFLFAGIALSIAAGLVCYYCIERPMDRWLRSRLDARHSAPALAAASR